MGEKRKKKRQKEKQKREKEKEKAKEEEERRRGEEPGSTRCALRKSTLDTCAPAIQKGQHQDNQLQS